MKTASGTYAHVQSQVCRTRHRLGQVPIPLHLVGMPLIIMQVGTWVECSVLGFHGSRTCMPSSRS